MQRIVKGAIYGLIGLLVVILFMGCPEAVPQAPPEETVQSVRVNILDMSNNMLSLEFGNPNDKAVQIQIMFTPTTPSDAMIDFDGEQIPFSEDVRIPLAVAGEAGSGKRVLITALQNEIEYSITIITFDNKGNSSSNTMRITIAATAVPGMVTGLTATNGYRQITLNWKRAAIATEYYVFRAIGSGAAMRIPTDSPITSLSYTNTELTNGTTYTYIVRAVNKIGESDDSDMVFGTPTVDGNGNMLIDVFFLEELNNIRYNLSGTSYKTDASGTGLRCGINSDADCIGYELMSSLDFADEGSYDTSTVNDSWRPNRSDPNSATNRGWSPIVIDSGRGEAESFTAIFEGNNNTISNLYARGYTNNYVGFFGVLGAGGVIRNLGMLDGRAYGIRRSKAFQRVGVLVGSQRGGDIVNSYAAGNGISVGGTGDGDNIGGLVGLLAQGNIINSYSTVTVRAGYSGNFGGLVGGQRSGSIINSYATGNSAGSIGDDNIGGLVGRQSGGRIINSYATGNSNSNAGNDNVGGLVGYHEGGSIAASYATGNSEGSYDNDNVGGLMGYQKAGRVVASYATGENHGDANDIYTGDRDHSDNVGGFVGHYEGGSISASYATGNSNGGSDPSISSGNTVGGFIGFHSGGSVIASYATGNSKGNAGVHSIGRLIGRQNPGLSVISSYGFGTISSGATSVTPPLPAGVSNASDLTAANVDTSGSNTWNDASSHTLGAWNFVAGQPPTLQYADYDGAGGIYACDSESSPSTTIVIPNCGTGTRLPGQ